MAAIHLQVRDLFDTVSEHVAQRSGILLSDHDMSRLIKDTPMKLVLGLFKEEPTTRVRVRAEVVDDLIRVLRAAVGNLPDATPADLIRVRLLMGIADSGLDPSEAFKIVDAWHARHLPIDDPALLDFIVANTSLPGWAAADVVQAFLVHFDRDVNLFKSRAMKVDWDGVVPLSQLFSEEHAPGDAELYFDQRFIDYLVAQGEGLHEMHWRNFERLIAEYFRRKGYVVKLGPGGSDGGIDIRVWPDELRIAGPPLLVVQCKRYAKGRRVKVEYVKAFYVDLADENAEGGLLATTGLVGPDGKRFAAARRYPLAIAEHGQIAKWVQGMWRYTYNEKAVTEGVGQYLSPHPLVVFASRPKLEKSPRRKPRRKP
jgi:restriction system protein